MLKFAGFPLSACLGFCAPDLGRHDVRALRCILAATQKRSVRRGHRRHSRPADAGAGLPEGNLPAANERCRGYRLNHHSCGVAD